MLDVGEVEDHRHEAQEQEVGPAHDGEEQRRLAEFGTAEDELEQHLREEGGRGGARRSVGSDEGRSPAPAPRPIGSARAVAPLIQSGFAVSDPGESVVQSVFGYEYPPPPSPC